MADKVRVWYVVPLAATVAMGFLNLGYGFAYFNVMTKLMHAQYVHRGEHVIQDKDLFNSLVSGLIPLGAVFGSFIINPFTKKGRRLCIICIDIVCIIGTGISLIFNMYALIFGRLIIGMCVGGFVAVCPLYISETSPNSMSGSLGAFIQMGAVLGIFAGFLMSLIMPLPNDSDANTTGLWRIVFCVPAIFTGTQLLLMLFVFRFDTPLFYKRKGDLENMKQIYSRIYVFKEGQTEPEDISSAPDTAQVGPTPELIIDAVPVADEEQSVERDDEQPSVEKDEQPSVERDEQPNAERNEQWSVEGDEEQPHETDKNLNESNEPSTAKVIPLDDTQGNLTKPKIVAEESEPKKEKWPLHYKKALFYSAILSILHQSTGKNAIIFFSNEIFTQGEEGNAAEIRARIGTLFLGLAGFIGIIGAVPSLKYMKRRTMIQISLAIIWICLFFCGVLAIVQNQIIIICFIFIYMFSFNYGIGGVMWVYCSDVLDEFGCAVIGVLNMFSTWVFGTFTNLGFKYLGAPAMYFGLTVVQIFAMLFVWLCLKETKGKSKEEREKIFMKKVK